MQKGLLDPLILGVLFKKGMLIKKKDIDFALRVCDKCLWGSYLPCMLLQMTTEPIDLEELLRSSIASSNVSSFQLLLGIGAPINNNTLSFLFRKTPNRAMIKEFAKLSCEIRAELISLGLQNGRGNEVVSLVLSCGPIDASSVDISALTKRIVKLEYIDLLIEAGAPVDGLHFSSVKSALLSNVHTKHSKASMICFLLKKGAKTVHMSLGGGSPLHVATTLALQSGLPICDVWLCVKLYLPLLVISLMGACYYDVLL